MGLGEKRIVVIGGSSGIGLAVAAEAIQEGANLFIGSSQPARIAEAESHLGSRAGGAVVNVAEEQSIVRFFEQAGAFDHLVYTAGDWAHRARGAQVLTESKVVEDFGQALTVRFAGALLAIKHAVGRIRSGGSITLTGGMVAHRPRKGAPLSTAMAGAVEHLTYGLAVDLAPIRVNTVCPGIIATAVWGRNAEEQFRTMTDPLPLPRMGTPAEVAEAYLYLMKAGYTTGQVLRVDGGRSLI